MPAITGQDKQQVMPGGPQSVLPKEMHPNDPTATSAVFKVPKLDSPEATILLVELTVGASGGGYVGLRGERGGYGGYGGSVGDVGAGGCTRRLGGGGKGMISGEFGSWGGAWEDLGGVVGPERDGAGAGEGGC